jgi:hypothetical protein
LPWLDGALEPLPAPAVPSLRIIVPAPAPVPVVTVLPEPRVVEELLAGLLSTPGLPWLDWANAAQVDRARTQAEDRTIFFIVISLGLR